jgi:GR25 family glycosyltransferase involved in LPS biosynthesis
MDSMGCDIMQMKDKSIDELKKICKQNKRCIGFNTLGWLKYYIHNETHFRQIPTFKSDNEGLYVYTKRYNKLKLKVGTQSYINFDGYTFYRNKDSSGNDMNFIPNKPVEDLKKICDSDPACEGFNTLGFMKNKIKHERDFINLGTSYFDGLYVKNKRFRVKMICNWCSSKDLCDEWNRMSKGNYRWNDIEITWDDKNIDFYVIINKPMGDEYYIPERTIIFHMEPWCYDEKQKWGVKTWGQWANPDESKFLQVRSHKKFYNNGFWQLGLTYNDLKTISIEKTKLLSTICSSKYFDPGHIKRIDFLKYIENKNDDVVTIDIYNQDNEHNFKSYKGPHPKNNKEYGILPYKYYFMPENNEEKNFMTEKIWEPLLTETLCFYWGCPNLSEYIDPRAYIQLDLNDFEKSFQIIKTAIINNEWEKRIEFIRMEKQKVLEYFNFFPTLERIIKHDFRFTHRPSNDEIIYHKYFKDLIGKKVNNIMFLHSCMKNNNASVLLEILGVIINSGILNSLDYLYLINIGDEIKLQLNGIYTNKLRIINFSRNSELFEKPTINLIHTFSKFHKNAKVLYIHTKGISYNETFQQINDWRNYMLYFLVEKHNICMDMLDRYDCVGCNYQEAPFPHFSGNFWWARSSYINGLNKITSNERHDCEWWLLNKNKNVNKYVMYNSGIDHYQMIFPRALYDTEETKNKFANLYKFDDMIRIKCVNLVRRPDRKTYTTNLLSQHNLLQYCDFFEAVDGKTLEATDELKQLFANNDFGTRRNFIGCAMSHLTLWKQLINDPVYDKYLIIEDDILLDNNFTFKFNMINEQANTLDWDLIYLGFSVHDKQKEAYYNKNKDIVGIRIQPYDTNTTIGGTFGYYICKSGAQKFVDFIELNGIKHGIDYLMFHYYKEMNLKHYEAVPQIIHSEYVSSNKIVDSDIQYDYNKLF